MLSWHIEKDVEENYPKVAEEFNIVVPRTIQSSRDDVTISLSMALCELERVFVVRMSMADFHDMAIMMPYELEMRETAHFQARIRWMWNHLLSQKTELLLDNIRRRQEEFVDD